MTDIPSALGLAKPLLSLASSAGGQSRLSILIYHRVLPQHDPLRPGEVTADTFRWQMQLLSRFFNPLALSDAVLKLQDNILPKRAVCVTFDDGYADNHDIALPILKETGVPATFFIASGYLNGGRMWNDSIIESLRRMPSGMLDLSHENLGQYTLNGAQSRIFAAQQLIKQLKYLPPEQRSIRVDRVADFSEQPLPNDLMMTSQQVKHLNENGMSIGGHTVNHPILSSIDEPTAQAEVAANKSVLEEIIGTKIDVFAYPNGKPQQDYLPRDVNIVRELGYKAAVSTNWGVAAKETDLWQLPRFTPWDKIPWRFLARLGWNYKNIQ